jgi:cell division protein FtsL
MLKLLSCLVVAVVVGVAMLQTRQQHLEINYQINKLHNQIEGQQAKLWSQQLQIAVYAGTPTISKAIEANALRMVPEQSQPQTGEGSDRPTYTALAR